jgi:acryloyl-coenzyme A reductase
MTAVDLATGTMRAYRLDEFGGPDVLRMTHVTIPTPGCREVLVRVAFSGVCGQDAIRRSGKVDRMLGAVIGHEIAGTVAAVGPGVVDFAIGDRVAILQRRSCHRCAACLRGQSVRCPDGVLYGEALDGGYAEYCVIDELASRGSRMTSGSTMQQLLPVQSEPASTRCA